MTRSDGLALRPGATLGAVLPTPGRAVAPLVGRLVTADPTRPVEARLGAVADGAGRRWAVLTVDPRGDSLYPTAASGERRTTLTPLRPPYA
ncbi:MAG: hypothetical protein P8170_09025 [Gemmatimonadota bacterium]